MKLTAEDLTQMREHLDNHLTDGHWYATCFYCQRRRRLGGNGLLGSQVRSLLSDLEEARAENAKLREFRKVIYEHLDKALTAMDRWPRASAPREKWLIRWTYLLQAVSAGPRIEDMLDSAAATEQEGKA